MQWLLFGLQYNAMMKIRHHKLKRNQLPPTRALDFSPGAPPPAPAHAYAFPGRYPPRHVPDSRPYRSPPSSIYAPFRNLNTFISRDAHVGDDITMAMPNRGRKYYSKSTPEESHRRSLKFTISARARHIRIYVSFTGRAAAEGPFGHAMGAASMPPI